MNYCHKAIKDQDSIRNAIHMTPPPDPSWPNTDHQTPESPYPPASSCAKCNDEKAAKKGFKMSRCSACKLTRYCWYVQLPPVFRAELTLWVCVALDARKRIGPDTKRCEDAGECHGNRS